MRLDTRRLVNLANNAAVVAHRAGGASAKGALAPAPDARHLRTSGSDGEHARPRRRPHEGIRRREN